MLDFPSFAAGAGWCFGAQLILAVVLAVAVFGADRD